ncbi:MAG: hypothetical protein AB1468_02215 [Candidatus Micrarchaeota archaeon]
MKEKTKIKPTEVGKKKTVADYDKAFRDAGLMQRESYLKDLEEIKDPSKINAIWQLGVKLGLEEDIPLLRKIANDKTEHENVRKEAKWAIDEIKKRAKRE